jgi:hypothetical protein
MRVDFTSCGLQLQYRRTQSDTLLRLLRVSAGIIEAPSFFARSMAQHKQVSSERNR